MSIVIITVIVIPCQKQPFAFETIQLHNQYSNTKNVVFPPDIVLAAHGHVSPVLCDVDEHIHHDIRYLGRQAQQCDGRDREAEHVVKLLPPMMVRRVVMRPPSSSLLTMVIARQRRRYWRTNRCCQTRVP